MRQVKERDWVNEREEKKKTGKGRPNKIYSLKVGFNEIIAHIEKQQIKGKIKNIQAGENPLPKILPACYSHNF